MMSETLIKSYLFYQYNELQYIVSNSCDKIYVKNITLHISIYYLKRVIFKEGKIIFKPSQWYLLGR